MYIPMIKLEFILVNFQWDTLSVAYQPSDFACEEQRAVEKWYKTIQNTKIVHGKFACWTIYIYTLFFFLRLHSFVVVVVDCTEVESGSTIEVRPIYLWIGMFYFYILSLTLFCIFVFFFLFVSCVGRRTKTNPFKSNMMEWIDDGADFFSFSNIT